MSAPAGYALGVDLGTSHTVAVVRWPDGRSRPLLVDGAPVMPSAVFMDAAGVMHVGRDAQRLAQTDPARFEPNPKHRIADGTVLLGEHDVPIVELLAAILRNVAAKAVEAVGHLPPTVLTFPAKWGPQRRAVLEQAAAKAGFQRPRMLPEPVAAAHYFAEVMRQPIPQNESVAVFDFGGGTLDIAVVRHEADGRFAVLSDGGLEDLGGLDVDAALIEYLGQAINERVPEIWRQLTQPANGTDRRNRRLFWDDVRGAKEMLSRTTVAPVPVPGVEAALHLTRDELERLATPLLSRAVAETQRVITGAGLSPEQLAGLFLVGGASRIPLVARLLHSQLGVAPTVLEQPELPVAEGGLAASFPQADEPTSPGAPSSPEAHTPPGVIPPPGDLTPPGLGTPPGPHTPPRDTTPPGLGTPTGDPSPAAAGSGVIPSESGTPWYKRRTNWITAGVGAIVLVVLIAWLSYDAYPQHDMLPLQQVGGEVAFPHERDTTPDVYAPSIDGDVAYYLTQPDSDIGYVTSIDLATGERIWDSASIMVEDAQGITADNGIVYVDERVSDGYRYTFLDPDTGEQLNTLNFTGSDWTEIVRGQLLLFQESGHVAAYDETGERQWQTDIGAPIHRSAAMKTWDTYAEPRNTVFDDEGTAWAIDEEGRVVVIDSGNGEITASKTLAAHDDIYYAYENIMFVADSEAGYSVSAYDMSKDLALLWTFKPEGATREADRIITCGEKRVCVMEDRDGDSTDDGIVLLSFADGGELVWESPDDQTMTDAVPAGKNLLISSETEDTPSISQMYDSDMDPIGDPVERGMVRVDSGSFMTLPSSWDSPKTTGEDRSFVGMGAQTGQRYELGTQIVIPQCDASDVYLTCATVTGMQVWSFRY